jgi:hypothetical protein
MKQEVRGFNIPRKDDDAVMVAPWNDLKRRDDTGKVLGVEESVILRKNLVDGGFHGTDLREFQNDVTTRHVLSEHHMTLQCV